MALAERSIADLERIPVAIIVWSGFLEASTKDPRLEGMAAFGSYLHGHYRRVRAFADGDEVWTRN